MTLAIGHRQGDVVVIDALRERRPPFSPDDVCGRVFGVAEDLSRDDGAAATAMRANGRVSGFASVTSVTSLPRSRRAICTEIFCRSSTPSGSTCSTTSGCRRS